MIEKRSNSAVLVAACLLSALMAGIVVYFAISYWPGGRGLRDTAQQSERQADDHEQGGHDDHDDSGSETIELPKPMWKSARLKIEPVARQAITAHTWATGKIMLNQSRTANIYSITEGRVHKVLVELGDSVDDGQLLAVIDSREVGTAKLDLLQAKLKQEFAKREYDFAKKVERNAIQLIEQLDAGESLDEINSELKNKPIGKYRDQLLGAYTELIRAKADYDRLQPIADSGAVPGSRLIDTKAKYNAAQSAFDAILEQLRFAVPQDALQSQQKLREAEQSIDVAKAKLNILGYSEKKLAELSPQEMNEELSHYELVSPFAGRIIEKNVVLGERVGTDTKMFSIADLSSLWVQADIYQKDLGAIEKFGNTLRFRAPTGSDGSMHTHEAKIFYRGDVIDPNTRTLLLRAVTENQDGHIKPGMFVEIEIPTEKTIETLAVADQAIQEVKDHTVVFVQVSETQFRLQSVKVGESSGGKVQIREGLKEGDKVVVQGAFALKSELMKGEITHGH